MITAYNISASDQYLIFNQPTNVTWTGPDSAGDWDSIVFYYHSITYDTTTSFYSDWNHADDGEYDYVYDHTFTVGGALEKEYGYVYIKTSSYDGQGTEYDIKYSGNINLYFYFPNVVASSPEVGQLVDFTVNNSDTTSSHLDHFDLVIKKKDGTVVTTINEPSPSPSTFYTLNYISYGKYDATITIYNYGEYADTMYSSVTTFTDFVEIVQLPPPPTTPVDANFTYNVSSGIKPLYVEFTNTSTNATSYRWEFQRDWTGHVFLTSYLENPSVTFNDVGYYNVTLNAYSDDGVDYKTVTHAIKVLDIPLSAPVASFTISEYSTVAPSSVTFTNTSIGEIDNVTWSYGDGTPDSSAYSTSHRYEYPGIYTVTLTVSNSVGSSQYTDTVTITEMGFNNLFGFYFIGDNIVPANVQFVDYTVFERSATVYNGYATGMYIVDADKLFRTGLLFQFVGITLPVGYYDDDGVSVPIDADTVFIITFIDNNDVSYGLYDSGGNIVHPTITDGGTGVSIETARLTDVLRNATYLWDFGDGETSTDHNPIHAYKKTGHFTVNKSMTVYGIVSTTTKENLIYTKTPSASINFTVTNPTGITPHTVNFSADVTLPYNVEDEVTYGWSFGDGAFNTTATPNVSHTYNNSGRYTATVTAFYGKRVVTDSNRNSIIIE